MNDKKDSSNILFEEKPEPYIKSDFDHESQTIFKNELATEATQYPKRYPNWGPRDSRDINRDRFTPGRQKHAVDRDQRIQRGRDPKFLSKLRKFMEDLHS